MNQRLTEFKPLFQHLQQQAFSTIATTKLVLNEPMKFHNYKTLRMIAGSTNGILCFYIFLRAQKLPHDPEPYYRTNPKTKL